MAGAGTSGCNSVSERNEGSPGKQRRNAYLSDIRDLFDEKRVEAIFSESIVEELKKLEHRPWADGGGSDQPITKNALARLLRHYGIKPDDVRIGREAPRATRKCGSRRRGDAIWVRKRPAKLQRTPSGIEQRAVVKSEAALKRVAFGDRDNVCPIWRKGQ